MTESNVYEGEVPLGESARLASNSFVNQALDDLSIKAMGDIGRRDSVWDIGCGENNGLQLRVLDLEASYTGLDLRDIKDQREVEVVQDKKTATFLQHNIRMRIPTTTRAVQVVHVRNLLAHFEQRPRLWLIARLKNMVAAGGRLVIIEEDWSSVRGSKHVEALRDLLLSATYFNARYGRTLFSEVSSVVGANTNRVFALRHHFEITYDYEPLLALAPIVIAGLRLQSVGSKDMEARMVSEARRIFRAIHSESGRKKPPGYKWPDAVAAVMIKQR